MIIYDLCGNSCLWPTAMKKFTSVTDIVTRIRVLEGNIISEQSVFIELPSASMKRTYK